MRKSRLRKYKQDRLIEHFVAGTTARTASSLCGVDPRRVQRGAAAIAVALAGLAGIFLAMRAQVTPFSGPMMLIFAFEAVVIGGIGTLEGPIIGTLVFFALRETLAELGTIYLMVLGLVAIVIMLKAPKGLWGLLKARFDLQLFPLGYRVSGQSSKKDT